MAVVFITDMAAVGSRFWSPKKRATAVVLRQEGYTYQEIATRIGGDKSGVRRVCLKFEEFGKSNQNRFYARFALDEGISGGVTDQWKSH
jgi:hypothetical protein